MTTPARTIRLRGTAEYRDEAEACLELPGDAAFVERGVMRSLVMRCPDGCGETLVVNLDPRSGKAWLADLREGTTLFPSVWRDGGCQSHFIVWKDVILWCDRFEDGNVEPRYEPAIEPRVRASLPADRYVDVVTIASALDLIVWDVSKAVRRLASRGEAREGTGDYKGQFRRLV